MTCPLRTLFLLAFSSHGFAQGSFYVRPGAQGAKDGSNWTKAYSEIPPALQRGATYFLGDGDYGKGNFDTAEAAEKTVTIKKATVAGHGTDEGWLEEFGDGTAEFTAVTFASDWWVFDGVERTTMSSGHRIRVSERSVTHLSEAPPSSPPRRNAVGNGASWSLTQAYC